MSSSRPSGDLTCQTCGESFGWEAPDLWPFGPPAVCPRCRKIRQEEEAARLEAEWQRQQAEFTRERELREVTFYQERGQLGKRPAGLTLADFDRAPHNEEAFAVASRWLEDPDRSNLIVTGPVGAGKSFLAACLYGELIGEGRLIPTLWLSAPHLLSRVKRGFHNKSDREATDKLIGLAQRVPVLILDDLGKTHTASSASWVEDQLYDIVDVRYGECLPTVITTEWRAEALAELVGTSVVSRLVHDASLAGLKEPTHAYRRPKEAS
ncbi:MAG: ATP-binding protein [Thermoleophilia bacterium]|nr:ATP-binding protein [Thermoleophilia bacterium]